MALCTVFGVVIGMLSCPLAIGADDHPSSTQVTTADYSETAEKPPVKLRWLPYQPKSARALTRTAVDSAVVPAATFSTVKPTTKTASDLAAEPAGDSSLRAASDSPFSTPPGDPTLVEGRYGELPPAPTKASLPDPARLELGATAAAPRSDAGPSPLQWTAPGAVPAPAAPKAPPAAATIEPPESANTAPPATDAALPEIPGTQIVAPKPLELNERCRRPGDVLKPISQITPDISAEKGDFPAECPVASAESRPTGPIGERIAGAWSTTTFTWTAAATCHKPLYFEDAQLERYGHSWGPYVQPFASGVHFFATVPLLPYMMGVYPPNECQYTLGYYRPGSCAPYMLDPFPLSIRGAIWEGAAWGAAVAIF